MDAGCSRGGGGGVPGHRVPVLRLRRRPLVGETMDPVLGRVCLVVRWGWERPFTGGQWDHLRGGLDDAVCMLARFALGILEPFSSRPCI